MEDAVLELRAVDAVLCALADDSGYDCEADDDGWNETAVRVLLALSAAGVLTIDISDVTLDA